MTRSVEDLRDRRCGGHPVLSRQGDDRRRPDQALVRARPPGCSIPRSDLSIQVELEKGDLARQPRGAATQRAVDEHAGGDPGTHRKEHEVLALLSDALHVFADRRHVDVVLEDDRRHQRVADGRDHPGALPPGELRCERQVIRPGTENTRCPDHHLVDVLERDARLRGEGLPSLTELRDDRFGSGARRPRRAAADDRAGEIDQRCPHPFATDIEAEHPPGAGVDVVELCARTRKAARPPHPPEESELDELAEDLGNRRLGEPCAPDHVGRGHGSTRVHQLESGAQVDGAQQAGLRSFRCRHRVCLPTNVSKVGYLQHAAGRQSRNARVVVDLPRKCHRCRRRQVKCGLSG